MRVNLIKMILRCTELLLTVLITAIIGNVIASNVDALGLNQAAVNFVMFVAVLSWIASILGVASFFASVLANPMILFPLDAAALLFTMIAGIVVAAKLRMVDCGDINSKEEGNDWIGFGSNDDEKKCRELQAGTVFAWFLFASYAGSFFFTFKDAREHVGGSFRSASRPSMSQIGV